MVKLRIRQVLNEKHKHGPKYTMERRWLFRWWVLDFDGDMFYGCTLMDSPEDLEQVAAKKFGVHPDTIEWKW